MIFSKRVKKGGKPALTIICRTDGNLFFLEIPVINLSATGHSIDDAYRNLSADLDALDFLAEGFDLEQKFKNIGEIQKYEMSEKRFRLPAKITLAFAILFFAFTIVFTPVLDFKYFAYSIFDRYVGYDLGHIADRVRRVQPENKLALKNNLQEIMLFVNDIVPSDLSDKHCE